MPAIKSLLFCLGLALVGCSFASAEGQVGTAAYYHDKFHGRPTASGEPYDKRALTAAHRRYPLGTRLEVTNLKNHRSVVLRVNDRGPWGNNRRILDVSRRAAEELGFVRDGLTKVEIRVLD